MQNPKKISSLIGIVIIIAVAVIAVGGVFVYQYFFSLREISQSETTKNWKTYRNDKHRFEIKHPANWKFYERDDFVSQYGNIMADSIYSDEGLPTEKGGYPFEINIIPNPKGLSAKDFVNNYLKDQKEDEPPKMIYKSAHESVVAGYTAYELKDVFTGDAGLEFIYISKDYKIFKFIFLTAAFENPNFPADEIENNKISRKMLSTLKFTPVK